KGDGGERTPGKQAVARAREGGRVVTARGSERQTRGGCRSRPRAGHRLHPGDRHGALRRRRCEWEQPHYFSWRPAEAGDAEWMFGKSRTRLAPGLDNGFLMDVGPPRAGCFGLRAYVDPTVDPTESRTAPGLGTSSWPLVSRP